MRTRRGAAALALVLCVGLLVGCSSKGSSTASDPGTTAAADTTSSAPTTTAVPGSPKALFLEQGNALCTKMGTDLKALGGGLPAQPSPADQGEVFRKAADLMAATNQQLEALTPPPGDEAAIAQVTTVFDQLATAVREFGVATASGDKAAIDAGNTKGNALSEQMNTVAGGYGLAACVGS